MANSDKSSSDGNFTANFGRVEVGFCEGSSVARSLFTCFYQCLSTLGSTWYVDAGAVEALLDNRVLSRGRVSGAGNVLKAQVDSTEGERLKYITGGTGQAMT